MFSSSFDGKVAGKSLPLETAWNRGRLKEPCQAKKRHGNDAGK